MNDNEEEEEEDDDDGSLLHLKIDEWLNTDGKNHHLYLVHQRIRDEHFSRNKQLSLSQLYHETKSGDLRLDKRKSKKLNLSNSEQQDEQQEQQDEQQDEQQIEKKKRGRPSKQQQQDEQQSLQQQDDQQEQQTEKKKRGRPTKHEIPQDDPLSTTPNKSKRKSKRDVSSTRALSRRRTNQPADDNLQLICNL
eukprot:UN02163